MASLSELKKPLKKLIPYNPDQQWVIDCIGRIVDELEIIKPEYGKMPYRGEIKDYPAFSALAAQPASEEHEAVYRRFQALYLLGLAKQAHHIIDKKVRSSMLSAGLACRRMSAMEHEGEPLWEIVRNVDTPERLCDQFEQLASREEQEGMNRYVLNLVLPILRDVRDQRNPHQRRLKRASGGSRLEQKSRRDKGPEASQEMPNYGWISPQPSKNEKNKLKKEGLAASEMTRSALAVMNLSNRGGKFSDKTDRMTTSQANVRMSLMARNIKASRQMPMGRMELLNEVATSILAQLDVYCTKVAEKRYGEKNKEANRPLAAMFLLGCSKDELGTIQVWRRVKDVPKRPRCAGIVLETEEAVIPVLPVDGGWRPKKSRREYQRETQRLIYLYIPTQLVIGKSLLEWARTRAGKKLYGEKSKREWEELAEISINWINKNYNTSLTADRITNFVRQAVYHQTGDVAESLTVSYAHRKVSDPRLYYYAPYRIDLATEYERVWEQMPRMPDAIGRTALLSFDSRYEVCVGSEAVPRTKAVQEMVEGMKVNLQRILGKPGRRSLKQWLEIHNKLTIYTIMQVLWVTGIRAVHDPIELENYDREMGFLCVTDKDSNDQYGARIVSFPTCVNDQVKGYLKYVKSTSRAILGKESRTLAFRLVDYKTGKIRHFDQRSITEHVPCYPFAPNGHRHYIRSSLRKSEVDAVYIDALLGHGGIGREPYARFSAITPYEMAKRILGAQVELWLNAKWGIIPFNKEYAFLDALLADPPKRYEEWEERHYYYVNHWVV